MKDVVPAVSKPLASVRTLLTWMILAFFVPGLAAGTFLLLREYQIGRAQLVTNTIQTARAMSQAVDAQIAQGELLAITLTTSDTLMRRDFAAFHQRVLRLISETSFAQSIHIHDRNGASILNTRVPFGQALPQRTNLTQILSVFESGKPAKPEVIFSPLTHLPVISIAVPVFSGTKVEYALAIGIAPNVFNSILTKQNLPPNWVAAVVDNSGTLAARTHAPEKFVGHKAVPALVQQLAKVSEGSDEGKSLEGIQTVASYSRSAQTGWSVAIGIPRSTLEAELNQRLLLLVIAATLMLALSMGLVRYFEERIAASVLALKALALSLGNGTPLVVPQVAVKEVEVVAQAMANAAQTLSERARALSASHETMASREAELADAQAIARIGSWTWDKLTDTTVASQEMLRIFGRRDISTFGQQEELNFTHEAWLALRKARLLVAETGLGYNLELPARHADGTPMWVNERGVAVRDVEGQVILVRATVQDITQRKLIEIELSQHRNNLEQLVHSRTAELEIAKDEAQTANEAKSRFLAAASHDLRQPLAALSLYTGMLKDMPLPCEQKVVANMQACVDNLSELLTDLLDLSKLEAGVVVPCVSDFPIADVFERLASLYAPNVAAKGMRLRIRPSTQIVRTDPVLLMRALSNFMENAIRYTEHGGMLIGCRRRLGKDWVEVWDTGIGIPNESKVEVFEAFKQLGDGARNQGSGLGLAIVAKTAALLGLGVSVRSQLGRGSVFAIEVPRGASNRIAKTALQVPVFRPLRIAVVEDSAMVREALVITLQALGHQVVAVANKNALLAELDQFQPDIVISDYRLTHGETGFDVVTVVKNRLGAEFPLILVTGDTDPALLRRMAVGGVVVLHKPLDLNALQLFLLDLTAHKNFTNARKAILSTR